MSKNTISSYCDAFALLLQYCRDCRGLPVEKITVSNINSELIDDFLSWLQVERGNSISTTNQRLGAIRSFFRYVQTKSPEHLLSCQKILSIKAKKKDRPLVHYLSMDDVKLILSQPDASTPNGRRDLAMLSLMYDTGARVQEIADLKVRDLRLENPPSVHLFGKGRKAREVPLMKETTILLKTYLEDRNLTYKDKLNHPLFFGHNRTHFTRAGISYILKKYACAARNISPQLPDSVSPHIMRHTKAMHLLQAGVNLVYIRDILGHVDIGTTEVYARTDTEMKRLALEKVNPTPVPASVPSWAKDKNLMQWLKNYSRSCS